MMTWRKILYWLPLPLLLAGIGYLLIYKQVDLIALVLIFGALGLGALSVANESKD